MSRSQHPFLVTSGLVLATVLAIAPTSLHAETTSLTGKDLNPQTSTKIAPVLTTTTSGAVKATATDAIVKSIIPSKSRDESPIPPASTTTGTKPRDSQGATVTGAKPDTGNNSPTKPPATAVSTSSPPAIEQVISLVLNLREKRVYVRKGDKVIAKYPVAIGKKGWETPVGEWQVMEKVANPGWTSFKDSTVLKPGKDNPLGERWIGFWTDGKDMIGFHGTSNLKSIGTAASHGCVRMYNKDVKALFPLVKVGTVVTVVAK